MEIKRNIASKHNAHSGATYSLTLINGRHVWYLCRDFDESAPCIKIDRERDYTSIYIAFDPNDLEV